jgi:hypothetical protein
MSADGSSIFICAQYTRAIYILCETQFLPSIGLKLVLSFVQHESTHAHLPHADGQTLFSYALTMLLLLSMHQGYDSPLEARGGG